MKRIEEQTELESQEEAKKVIVKRLLNIIEVAQQTGPTNHNEILRLSTNFTCIQAASLICPVPEEKQEVALDLFILLIITQLKELIDEGNKWAKEVRLKERRGGEVIK